ncbi:retrovirus-related pol polyprotein from transposon TNT 1-94 [Tanacetum coccineum]
MEDPRVLGERKSHVSTAWDRLNFKKSYLMELDKGKCKLPSCWKSCSKHDNGYSTTKASSMIRWIQLRLHIMIIVMINVYSLCLLQRSRCWKYGGTIEQHPTTVEETRAYFESLYNNLVTEVEKVNTVNRKMRETNADLTTELARYKGQEKSFEINKAKFDELQTAKFIRDFKSLAKEANETLDMIMVLEKENDRQLRAVVSQDIMSIVQQNAHLKTTYKNLFDSINVTRAQTKIITDSLQDKLNDTIYENAKLRAQLFDKVSEQKDTTKGTSANTKFANQSTSGTKLYYVTPLPKTQFIPKVVEMIDLSKPVTSNLVPTTKESKVVKNDKVIAPGMFRINPSESSREDKFVPINKARASVRTNPITVSQPHVVQICLRCVDSGCFKHMTENLKLLINFVWKFLGTFRFGNDHIAAILGYGDLQWGNILITRVYFIEGLGCNPFLVGQFCDSDLEVAFRRNTYFVRNLEGVDLLKTNRTTNLYTINLHEMAAASPICLMARATSTKSWLWHQRLSHLNFDTINELAKNDLVSGLLKFKYHKEHLFPSSLCYPKNDREDIGELGAKDDIGFFIGYSANFCAYRVYNRRTRKIMEMMNVTIDELSAMAFEQRSSKPILQSMTSRQISSGLDLTYAPSTITSQKLTECELDLLFEAMYDDYISDQPSAAPRTALAAHHLKFFILQWHLQQ